MTGFMGHSVKKAIEIWLHPSNFNRDVGFALSHLFYSAKSIIKQIRNLKNIVRMTSNKQHEFK
jgi:hypothetical protein